MANTLHDVQISEGARQILDTWQANRIANKYQLNFVKNQGLEKDTLVKSSEGKNINDDGKISWQEKAENFYNGLTSPIHTMLASPKNFLLTLGAIAMGAGLIFATSGAAAPVLVAAGLLSGGASIGKGIYNQSNAKTDNEAKQAWKDIGSGTFTLGLSAMGAKPSLKAANIKSPDSSIWASFKCITNLPNCLSKIATSLKSKLFPSSAATTGVVNQIPKSQKTNQTQQNASTQAQTSKTNEVTKVADEDIEVLPPEKPQKTDTKNGIKDEDIIDAEYKDIKDLPQPNDN